MLLVRAVQGSSPVAGRRHGQQDRRNPPPSLGFAWIDLADTETTWTPCPASPLTHPASTSTETSYCPTTRTRLRRMVFDSMGVWRY